MLSGIGEREQNRVGLQGSLDALRAQADRNRLGQFATPTGLAEDMLRYAAGLLPANAQVRFLDPAIGTGSFYSALLNVMPQSAIDEALGYEIDPHYGGPAVELWRDTPLKLADFTTAAPSPRFNLLVCNPPYVRHHHLQPGDKARLQFGTLRASGMRISGLAGLYCHFLGLAHAWMADGAVAGWLIPSEFMDVNYGQAVKQYLAERVSLLHIHRFDPNDVQFADALVSSVLVWFRNVPPPAGHEVRFTFGGTLCEPRLSRSVPVGDLVQEPKWTRFPAADVRRHDSLPTLADFFQIRRGVATGDNDYFILSEAAIAARRLPLEAFTPILPSPRHLRVDEIRPRDDGTPDIEHRLFLLDTQLAEEDIRQRYASLAAYLDEGRGRGVPERYLCQHRSPWYRQEHRPPAPIVCTYLGRGDTRNGRPFRFVLNRSRATVANVWLALYPKPVLARAAVRDPGLLRKLCIGLNQLPAATLLGEGRVYGGGLHKLEPRELGSVPAAFLLGLLPDSGLPGEARQLSLFGEA